MKKAIFVIVAMTVLEVNVYSQTAPDQNSQWDFFINVIPRNKSITISMAGGVWSGAVGACSMTIDDKYKVTFSGNRTLDRNKTVRLERDGYESERRDEVGGEITYSGTGSVIWDNNKMKIILPINASGSSRAIALMRNIRDKRYWSQEFYSYGNSNIVANFDLISEYQNGKFTGRLNLSPNVVISMNFSGDFNISDTATISTGWFTAKIVPKTESELNATSKDAFGEWKWNTDRSKLFLKSMSSDNNFVIWNKDGEISWSMEMEKSAKGASESATETGDKLINLSMSFDGATAQVFSFVENKDVATSQNIMQLDYAVYNRFLGTLDKKSDVILKQIKDKRMLILTYTINSAQKTDMFLLEGLDTIMEYLSK